MKSLIIESATDPLIKKKYQEKFDPLIKKKNDNEIIILPVNDVHFSKVVSYLDFVDMLKVYCNHAKWLYTSLQKMITF